jgi:hypothetical protein
MKQSKKPTMAVPLFIVRCSPTLLERSAPVGTLHGRRAKPTTDVCGSDLLAHWGEETARAA